MKKIILLFVIISLLIGLVVSLNSKPTIVEDSIKTAQPVSGPSFAEVQKNSGKVLAVMPQSYETDEEPKKKTESTVPWEELDARWMDELKTLISGLDPEGGENRFHAFSLIREKWNKYNEIHSKQTKTLTIRERTLTSEPKVTDKKAYDKLVKEWMKAFDDYKQQTRIIFGPHYEEVKKFNSEFDKSIQSYGRDPNVPLGIESAFLE